MKTMPTKGKIYFDLFCALFFLGLMTWAIKKHVVVQNGMEAVAVFWCALMAAIYAWGVGLGMGLRIGQREDGDGEEYKET